MNVRRDDEVIACNVYLVITLTDMIPAVPFPSLEECMAYGNDPTYASQLVEPSEMNRQVHFTK